MSEKGSVPMVGEQLTKDRDEKSNRKKIQRTAGVSRKRLLLGLAASIGLHLPVVDEMANEGRTRAALMQKLDAAKNNIVSALDSKEHVRERELPTLKEAAEKGVPYSNPELGIHELLLEKTPEEKIRILPGQANRVDWIRFLLQDRVRKGLVSKEMAEKKDKSAHLDIERFQAMAAKEPDRKKILHAILNERGAYAEEGDHFEDIICSAEETMNGKEAVGNCYTRQQKHLAYITAVYPDMPIFIQELVHHARPVVQIGEESFALDFTPAPLYAEDMEGTTTAEATNYLSGYLGTVNTTTYYPETQNTPVGNSKAKPAQSDLDRDFAAGAPRPTRSRTVEEERPDYVPLIDPDKQPTKEFGGSAPKYAPPKVYTFEEAQAMVMGDKKHSHNNQIENWKFPEPFNPNAMYVTLLDADKIKERVEGELPAVHQLSANEIRRILKEETRHIPGGAIHFSNPHLLKKQILSFSTDARPYTAERVELTALRKVPEAHILLLDGVTIDPNELIGTEITQVRLGNCNIVNFAAFSKTKVSSFYMNGGVAGDTSGLTDSVFTQISLKNTDIDTSFIQYQRDLKSLTLAYIDFQNWEVLSGKQVEALDVSDVSISEQGYNVIAQFPLKDLSIENIAVPPNFFHRLPHLKKLELYYGTVSPSDFNTDLRGLQLESIILDGPKLKNVKDFSFLEGIKTLQEVYIARAQNLTDISFLTSLPNLRKLSFRPKILSEEQNTGVRDLRPFKKQIEAGKIIIELPYLFELDLNNYQIVPEGKAKKPYKMPKK